MAITITEQPPGIQTMSTATKAPPQALTDCWRWCVEADPADAYTTPGVYPTVTITLPLTCTVPANGTALTIWGIPFTVQSAEAYTSNSFKVETNGLATAINLASMIGAHPFLGVAVTTRINSATFHVLTVQWKECREQSRFTSPDMLFTAITAAGGSGSATNGTSPVYVDGFRISSRLVVYQDATTQAIPLTEYVGQIPEKLCSTVAEVCSEQASAAQSVLYTDLPALSKTSKISTAQLGRSLMRLFALQVGWIYRENCEARAGDFIASEIVLGINAAFDVDELYGMRRYWYDHTDGFPPGQSVQEYLTTQPKTQPISIGSFAWLWMTNNFQRVYGSAYLLWARFIVYKKGVTGVHAIFEVNVLTPGTDGNEWYRAANFNVSPQIVLDNVLTVDANTLQAYEIQVVGRDAGGVLLFNATEYIKYDLQGSGAGAVAGCAPVSSSTGDAAGGVTDIYFLTPPGGISTVPVVIESYRVISEGTEINLNVACDSPTKATHGGRTLKKTRLYRAYSFAAYGKNTQEFRRWMEHLKGSPQVWVKLPDQNGGVIARKLVIEPGTFEISTGENDAEWRFTGYLQDTPTQAGELR